MTIRWQQIADGFTSECLSAMQHGDGSKDQIDIVPVGKMTWHNVNEDTICILQPVMINDAHPSLINRTCTAHIASENLLSCVTGSRICRLYMEPGHLPYEGMLVMHIFNRTGLHCANLYEDVAA